MQNANEKTGMSGGIYEFIQKRRKPIFISAGLALLLLVAFVAALSFIGMLKEKAIAASEEFNRRYEALQASVTDDLSEKDLGELLAELEVFAKKNSGYAGGKAWSIMGAVYSEKKEWAQAEAAWASAAKAAKKTYLVPLAWFNAGAAAEEQGKTEAAVEYYSNSLAYAAGFPAAPRAQFAIGRLSEALNQNEAAIEAYRAVISSWPYDQAWASLAHSRIIALEN
ncbi:MAG: tetratricopeptide repeat protein [Treponema sp.]|jgi:tetratricopeptide (TPR) repeat protein|nr:tetratricopeptide repeat protein [Treponema sp.]